MSARTCEEWMALASARMDGELSPDRSTELESHLAACPSCHALETEFREDERRLVLVMEKRTRERPLDLGPRVFERIRAGGSFAHSEALSEAPREAPREAGRGFRLFTLLAAGASLAAALVLSFGPAEFQAAPGVPDPSSHETVALDPSKGSVVAVLGESVAASEEAQGVAREAEACFYAIVNATDAEEFRSVQAGLIAADLPARANRIATLRWSDPEAGKDLGNLAQTLSYVLTVQTPGSPGSLTNVQGQLLFNGALLSCENIIYQDSANRVVDSSAGANFIRGSYGENYSSAWMNVQANGGGGLVGTPDALLFRESFRLVEERKPEEAILRLEDLATTYPESRWTDDALFRMGQIYELELRDYSRARESYQRVFDSFPQGQFEAACRLPYSRALANDQQWYQADENLRYLRNRVGVEWGAQARAGIPVDNRMLELARNEERRLVLMIEAEESMKNGNTSGALPALDLLLGTHPAPGLESDALALKARAFQSLGRTRDAALLYRRVLDDHGGSRACVEAEESLRVLQRAIDLEAEGK